MYSIAYKSPAQIQLDLQFKYSHIIVKNCVRFSSNGHSIHGMKIEILSLRAVYTEQGCLSYAEIIFIMEPWRCFFLYYWISSSLLDGFEENF